MAEINEKLQQVTAIQKSFPVNTVLHLSGSQQKYPRKVLNYEMIPSWNDTIVVQLGLN